MDARNFRLFSPDENNSNRWQDVLEVIPHEPKYHAIRRLPDRTEAMRLIGWAQAEIA